MVLYGKDEQLRARPEPHLRAAALRSVAQPPGTWNGRRRVPAAVLRRRCGSGPYAADRACLGRVRLDPRAGGLLRAGRPAPDAGAQHDGALFRRIAGGDSPPSTQYRSQSATAPRSSMRPAGPGPGDPYIAPPPRRARFSTRSVPIPARCASPLRATRPMAPRWRPTHSASCRRPRRSAPTSVIASTKVDPAIDVADVVPTFRTISAIQILYLVRAHPAGRTPQPGELETVVADTAKLAEGIDGATYMAAVHTAHRIGRQMAAFHEDWDVLLTPGLGTLPPKLGWLDMMMDDLEEYWRRVFCFSPFTVWFNLTGQPAMMIPLGVTESGFPIAVQAIAPLRRRGDAVPSRGPARRGAAPGSTAGPRGLHPDPRLVGIVEGERNHGRLQALLHAVQFDRPRRRSRAPRVLSPCGRARWIFPLSASGSRT